MKMVVRFEVDACLPAPELDVDDLADALGNITSASTSPTTTSSVSPALNLIHAGIQVPQEALQETHSRSKYFIDQRDFTRSSRSRKRHGCVSVCTSASSTTAAATRARVCRQTSSRCRGARRRANLCGLRVCWRNRRNSRSRSRAVRDLRAALARVNVASCARMGIKA